jgi:hypothetical protein
MLVFGLGLIRIFGTKQITQALDLGKLSVWGFCSNSIIMNDGSDSGRKGDGNGELH